MRHCKGCSHPTICDSHGCGADEARANMARKTKADESKTGMEALRRDADRYRWLREQPNDTDAPRIDVVFWEAEDESTNSGKGLRTHELDAAIDEALRHNARDDAASAA